MIRRKHNISLDPSIIESIIISNYNQIKSDTNIHIIEENNEANIIVHSNLDNVHVNKDDNDDNEFIIYPYRWWILFSILEISNTMLWVTFAPINNLVSSYLVGDYGSTTSVNMIANIFLILYGPGTILSIYLLNKYNT